MKLLHSWYDIDVDAKRKHVAVRNAMIKTGGGYPHPETPSNSSFNRPLSVIGSAVVDGKNDTNME